MRKLFGTFLVLALILGVGSAYATTVVVPDPSPQLYIFYGTGDASVTYSGAVFTQQAALGNANLWDIGPLFQRRAGCRSSRKLPLA